MRFSPFLRFYPSELKKLKSVLEFDVNCPSLWRKQLCVHELSSAFYRRNKKFEKCRIFRQIVEKLKGHQFYVKLHPLHKLFRTKLKERKIPSNGNTNKVNHVVLTEKGKFFKIVFPIVFIFQAWQEERSFWNMIKLMTNDPYPMGCCEKCRTIGELLFLLSKWDERAPLKNPLIFTAFNTRNQLTYLLIFC